MVDIIGGNIIDKMADIGGNIINKLVDIIGGNDKNAVVFNKDTQQVMAILKGHTKKVTSVIYHPEEVCSFLLH
jgi:hypothetical protein